MYHLFLTAYLRVRPSVRSISMDDIFGPMDALASWSASQNIKRREDNRLKNILSLT